LIKQYQNTLDVEIKDVSNVELSKISRMVIYSQGKTIRPDGMYPLMVTVIHNVGHAIIDMGQTNGHTLDGTLKNSDIRRRHKEVKKYKDFDLEELLKQVKNI